MPTRKASAVWEGGLKGGKGNFRGEGGGIGGAYSFSSRFEEGTGSRAEFRGDSARCGNRVPGERTCVRR